jgi:hypothetical protein
MAISITRTLIHKGFVKVQKYLLPHGLLLSNIKAKHDLGHFTPGLCV